MTALAAELRKPENGMKLEYADCKSVNFTTCSHYSNPKFVVSVEISCENTQHCTVVYYDVSEQPVSVHIPLCRLLAALYARYNTLLPELQSILAKIAARRKIVKTSQISLDS